MLSLTVFKRNSSCVCNVSSVQAIACNCNQLQYLNLGWCEGVGDKGVISLALGCPNLSALDLCGCVLITGTEIFGFSFQNQED